MSNFIGPDHEPQVLQFARYNASDEDEDDYDYLHCIRVSSEMPTFLLQDTAALSEDVGPLGGGKSIRELEKLGISHRYIELKHQTLPVPATLFCPEQDVLWFSHEIDNEDVNAMAPYYGVQLGRIRNVIFEETEWDATKCLKLLEHFPGVQTIYVWLDSYRFQPGAAVATEEEYIERAKQHKMIDQVILRERELLVEYIDENRDVYGGFRVTKDESMDALVKQE
ncbi:hypothetical protein NQ176_g1252 [Zarea fungicola]|uniref:Uncharacterized protein n=1 Tax=Zarea fungicola TaxID=93591 RepID=A0ACC1NUR7_9HYPO|nr:hypothetical protein NQ176_g1252 [Lecanicillium fungicola]